MGVDFSPRSSERNREEKIRKVFREKEKLKEVNDNMEIVGGL